MSVSLIKDLLKKSGFPDFNLDNAGFPDPGSVIRYFRENMKYTDPVNNKERHWTQADLAKRLGLSEITVRLMETQNIGNDSMTRRRALIDILKIPPLLLGLGSINELESFLRIDNIGSSTTTTVAHSTDIHSVYQDALKIHWDMHYFGYSFANRETILQWMKRLETEMSSNSSDVTVKTLCSYYQLIANIYGDHCMFDKAFPYLDSALELATANNDLQAQAATLYRFGHIRLDQRKFQLARSSLMAALELVDHASPQLKGAIYQTAGLSLALTARSNKEKTQAQHLIDKAGNFATMKETEDIHFVQFSSGRHFLEKADSLIALGKPSAALTALDDAEDGINISQKRRHAYINILRAEAYTKLKKPQFDVATDLLSEAFNVSTSIDSVYNVEYILRLYTDLSTSTFGKSTDVADLGLSLRNWKKNTTSLHELL